MIDYLEELVQDVQNPHFEVASQAITDLRLMIERFSLNRQNHPTYKEMYSALLGNKSERNLSTTEFSEVIDLLTSVLQSGSPLAIQAAWALGRTADLEVSVELIKCLERWGTNSDDFNAALLSALSDEHGFPYGGRYRWGQLIELTHEIAIKGGHRTKEIAQVLISTHLQQMEDI